MQTCLSSNRFRTMGSSSWRSFPLFKRLQSTCACTVFLDRWPGKVAEMPFVQSLSKCIVACLRLTSSFRIKLWPVFLLRFYIWCRNLSSHSTLRCIPSSNRWPLNARKWSCIAKLRLCLSCIGWASRHCRPERPDSVCHAAPPRMPFSFQAVQSRLLSSTLYRVKELYQVFKIL